MASKYMLWSVENGVEFELPSSWTLVEVASSDSFRTWLLLKREKASEGE